MTDNQIPWHEPHRLRVNGHPVSKVDQHPDAMRVFLETQESRWFYPDGRVVEGYFQPLKLTVLPEEPVAPAFDPGKPWVWQPVDSPMWYAVKREYQGQMSDGRHVLSSPDDNDRLHFAQAVRNIPEPQPEPAPVDEPEGPEIVAWAVMFGENVHSLCYDKAKADKCASLTNGTVRPLYLHPAPPRGESLGWLNIYPGIETITCPTKQAADEANAKWTGLPDRIACVEIFKGMGL